LLHSRDSICIYAFQIYGRQRIPVCDHEVIKCANKLGCLIISKEFLVSFPSIRPRAERAEQDPK
jgi:hypothetical protein